MWRTPEPPALGTARGAARMPAQAAQPAQQQQPQPAQHAQQQRSADTLESPPMPAAPAVGVGRRRMVRPAGGSASPVTPPVAPPRAQQPALEGRVWTSAAQLQLNKTTPGGAAAAAAALQSADLSHDPWTERLSEQAKSKKTMDEVRAVLAESIIDTLKKHIDEIEQDRWMYEDHSTLL
jgi:hypothetical protein